MPGLTPSRGLVKLEEPLDIVTASRGFVAGHGLVKYEQVRKRFIRPKRYFAITGEPIVLAVTDIPEVVMAVMQPA